VTADEMYVLAYRERNGDPTALAVEAWHPVRPTPRIPRVTARQAWHNRILLAREAAWWDRTHVHDRRKETAA